MFTIVHTMLELILALILALTGVQRAADPSLAPLAERRALEIVADFSHAGMQSAEVLHYNFEPTPEASAAAAVAAWEDSPTHLAILSDPSLTRIWCASAQGLDPLGSGLTATFWACVLARDEVLLPPPADPYVQAPPESPAPLPVLLPDTALSGPP